jgi:hypothetical protein
MAKTVHVVMRHNWRRAGGRWFRLPGQARLATFEKRREAESDQAAREANARRRVNPFECGTVQSLTSLPGGVFIDLLADLGLEPPALMASLKRDWLRWWLGVPEQKRGPIWEALDRLRFYAVVERPACRIGYALVGLNWHYNDQNYFLNDEGGTVHAVYRTRERAEEVGRQRFGSHREGASLDYFPTQADPLDPESVWRMFQAGPHNFEVVEIELEGLG